MILLNGTVLDIGFWFIRDRGRLEWFADFDKTFFTFLVRIDFYRL